MAEMILGIPRITIDLDEILSTAATNSHTTLFLLEGSALDRLNQEIERLRFLGKAFATKDIYNAAESVAPRFRNFDTNIRSSSGPGDLETGRFESDEAELRTSLVNLERILEGRLRRRLS